MSDEIIIDGFVGAEVKKKIELDLAETKQWVDRNSRMSVTEEIPIDGSNSIFKTQIGIPTNAGTLPLPIVFPEGYSLQQCFEEFEDFVNIAVETFEKEMQNQIIAAPSGIDSSILKA